MLGTKEFCEWVCQVLDENNINSTLNKYQKNSNKNTYNIIIGKRNNQYNFINYLYRDAQIYLYRKYHLAELIKRLHDYSDKLKYNKANGFTYNFWKDNLKYISENNIFINGVNR